MRIYCTLGLIWAFYLFQADAQQCGGLFEADNGHIDIPPSNVSCLWVVKLQDMTGISLSLNRRTVDPMTVIPEQNTFSASFQSVRISLKKSYTFEGKSFAIMAPARSEQNSIVWAGVSKDHSRVSVSAKVLTSPNGVYQWESKVGDGMEKVLWAIEPSATGKFNWTLDSDVSQCGTGDNCQCLSLEIFQVKQNGDISQIEKACQRSSTGSVDVDKNFRLLIQMRINATVAKGSKLQVTWKSEPIERSVEGIIVGTEGGLYVIALNSSNATLISSKDIRGVAFDWNSRKLYWVEEHVGILRANLDGTGQEKLIADTDARGLAIEPVSGNFYYGSWTKKAIRICNNDAEKCSTIVNTGSSSGVFDIAIHETTGYLFWSIWATQIGRANLDGTNRTINVQAAAHGIGVDQRKDRIYWSLGTYDEPKVIASTNLNGQDRRILPNIETRCADVEIVGDTVYYTNRNNTAGVFLTGKQATDSTLVASFPHKARYIASFGTKTPSQRANPCVNVGCAHLCVPLSETSYRCVDPDALGLEVNESSEDDSRFSISNEFF